MLPVTARDTPTQELFRRYKTSVHGLTAREVGARLKTYGLNQIQQNEVHWWWLLLKQFASPFVYLLLASSALSFLFHDQIGGWMILGFILLNAGLGFFQEYHAERAVAMLRAILRPSTTVIREGVRQRIASTELVPGDLCVVEVGDIVPADGLVIEAEACLCDESVLTGESFPVTKQATQSLQAGTKITQGWATYVIVKTGRATSLGAIATLTSETTTEGSYQRSIRRLSTAILWFVVAAVLATFVLRLIFQGSSTLSWIQFAIFSVALAVSVVPETLPLVVTICLSRGALSMAKKQVVVKRLNAIEDLGSIDILCTDKTGTLTENQMRVAGVETYTEDPRRAALWALEPERFARIDELDPFDRAMAQSLMAEGGPDVEARSVLAHRPFDPVRKRVTVLIRRKKQLILISYGAAEEIQKRCIEPDQRFRSWLSRQGKQGRRTLAVATRYIANTSWKKDLHALENGMTLCGGVSFEDPLKATSVSALRRIQELGVKVKMLTGDSLEVATAIAKRVGLVSDQRSVLTGEAFLALSSAERRRRVQSCAVFARVDPAQKYAIIQELQRHGSVGFLGEGINDAPALKLANVGIAVKEASDIAREAADIILLDKGLDVIAEGMTQGRQVFVNIGKYIRATLVSNFGNFFAVVISLFFIPTLPMLPVQILLLNLLSDFPMTAICVDTVESNEVRAPVRFPVKSLLIFCLTLGTVSTVFDFLFFTAYYRLAPSHLQVMWFLASVFTELLLIFSLRTSRWFFQSTPPPKALWFATVLAALAAFVAAFVEPFQAWFSFPRPTMKLLLITLVLVTIYFFVTDLAKRGYGKLSSRMGRSLLGS